VASVQSANTRLSNAIAHSRELFGESKADSNNARNGVPTEVSRHPLQENSEVPVLRVSPLAELNRRLQSNVRERGIFIAPRYDLVFYAARKKHPSGKDGVNWQKTHEDGNYRIINIEARQKVDPTSNIGRKPVPYENQASMCAAPADFDVAGLKERIERETSHTLPRGLTVRRADHEHHDFAKTSTEQNVTFDLEDPDLPDPHDPKQPLHLGEWRGAATCQTVAPGSQHPDGSFYEVVDVGETDDPYSHPVYPPMPDWLWAWFQKYRKNEEEIKPSADDELPRQRHDDFDAQEFLEKHCGLRVVNVRKKPIGTYYNVSTCPRIGRPHQNHSDTSTALVLTASGSLGFQCNSTGCSEFKLAAFLDWAEKNHGEYKFWKFDFVNPDYEQPLAWDWVKENRRVMRITREGDCYGYRNGIWSPHRGIQYSVQEYLAGHAGAGDEGLSKRQQVIRRALLSRRLASNVTSLASCNPSLEIDISAFDKDPLLAGLPGGLVLDLKTRMTRASTPEDLISKAFKVMPGRPDGCPVWLEFLKTTHPDEAIRAFLKRFLGLCLTGLTRDNLIMFFVDMAYGDDGFNQQGNGGRGKGTTLYPFTQFMGPYYRPLPMAAISSDSSSDRHDTSLANLPGARLAVLTEIPAKSMKHQSASFSNEALKKISGGDRRISYRKMRGDPGEFDPMFKPVILANKPPRLDEVEGAIEQRLLFVPFTQTFRDTTRCNVNLKEQLDSELSSILGWAAEGCSEYLQDGLNAPANVKVASKTCIAEADNFAAWLAQDTEVDQEAWSSTRQMFAAWDMYCKIRNQDPSDEKWFVASLRERRNLIPHRQHIGSKNVSGFKGIRLLYENRDVQQDLPKGV
jgi:P4 family phage/plasmid primase-like protien